MGAFCVFGVSKTACKLAAERRTPTFINHGEECQELSISEWAVRRDALAQKLFDTSDRTERISPEFDAPQFCHDWITVAGSNARMTTVMVRGPKIDKGGAPIKRNGVPLMTWVEFRHIHQFKKVAA